LGKNYPVDTVSWNQCVEFIRVLNEWEKTDKYRLPTEAEWEYAARAGTDTRFAQGDDLTADQANFSRAGTEYLRARGREPTVSLPELVDRYIPVAVNELDAANAWGVRHMSGNVEELTQSCWSDEHLHLSSDSAYLANGDAQRTCRRVAKGGAFNTAMDHVRPARRFRPTEDFRRDYLGFRVVRELHGTGGR
jgi:formylglycine-generating enzyme required for sulfatase activity